MQLARWDPFREFGSLQDRINRMFEDVTRGLPAIGDGFETGAWIPAVDIHETDNSFVVTADLPGMKKDDIRVDLRDNTLTLSGEKKFEETTSKDNYLRVERSYGSFYRSLMLPSNVDANNIKASYKEGVLQLTIPKKEEAKPKQIKIETK